MRDRDGITVTAPTLDEAYRIVKARFGADAVLLDTRTVTRPASEGLGSQKLVQLTITTGAERSGPVAAETDVERLVARLEEQVATLESRLIATVRTGHAGDDDSTTALALSDGATPDTATRWAVRYAVEAKDNGGSDPVTWIAEQLRPASGSWTDISGLQAILGPSGSGRTRLAIGTAKKIADAGGKVLVLAVAPSHPGEVRRLQAEAAAGRFDAAVIRSPEQIVELENNLSDYQAVLLDLPSLEDPALTTGTRLQQWIAGHHGIHRHLLVPLDLDLQDLDELSSAARSLNCDWLALGRLDRTRRPAKILDLVDAIPLPISLVAGFEAAEIASTESLARLLSSPAAHTAGQMDESSRADEAGS